MLISPLFYDLDSDEFTPRHERYNARFKPKCYSLSSADNLKDMYTLCLTCMFQGENYIITTNPGFKINIYSNHTQDNPVPNAILWWSYQMLRTHVTLLQHAFFGHDSQKGTNFYYMLKDLNFVDDWLWDNALHQCAPFREYNSETFAFVENIRKYFSSFERSVRHQKMQMIIDQLDLFISENDVVNNTIDEDILRTIIQDLTHELPNFTEEQLFL